MRGSYQRRQHAREIVGIAEVQKSASNCRKVFRQGRHSTPQRKARSVGGRTPATYNSLRAAAAQLVDFLLHFVELALQVVDIAGLRRGLSRLGLDLAVSLAPRERREHREGALEHFHVPPHLILQRREPADAEGLRHLIAELFLLTG